IEKDRTRRYETATGLAIDIERHLKNETVAARPPSVAYRFQRAFRRNRLFFGAAGAVFAALVGGISASLWQAHEASNAKTKAEQASMAAQAERDKAEASERSSARNLYAANINLAHRSWSEGDLAQAENYLRAATPQTGREDLRGFEWRYLHALCRDESRRTVSSSDFHAGARKLALGSGGAVIIAAGNAIRSYDMQTGARLSSFEADSVQALASSTNEPGLVAYTVANGIRAFSPNGETLLGGGVAHDSCNAIAWSPDRSILASAGREVRSLDGSLDTHSIKLWNRKDGALLAESILLSAGVSVLAFSADSKYLVCGSEDTAIHILEYPGLREIKTLQGHTAFVVALAFDLSGRRLASGSHDGSIILWDFPGGRKITRLFGHQGRVHDLAFSPDGVHLVSGGIDRALHVWNLEKTSLPVLLRGHRNHIDSVLISGDGAELYSMGEGELKVWSLPSDRPANALYHGHWLSQVAFSPSGDLLAAADFHATAAVLWDVQSRTRKAGLEHHAASGSNVAFSPDGKLLATVRFDGSVQVSNLVTSVVTEFAENRFGLSLAFHPTRPILAVASFELHFYDTETWKPLRLLLNPPTGLSLRVAFSPDGQKIAVTLNDGSISLWNLSTGVRLRSSEPNGAGITALAFSHDGSRVAAAVDQRVVLYNTERLSVIARIENHLSQLDGLAFAPDDKTLVSASWDGSLRFWRLDSQQTALTLVHDGGPVTSVAFSPTQNLMASTGSDGYVRLWPATPWAELDAEEHLKTPLKSRGVLLQAR
ncbi:MAG TPA: hypothetical protein VGR78_03170, partial [Verrucomicrobiae bacterium]|nr:hypothetical protein [Verrucomicrobiae bacterium]